MMANASSFNITQSLKTTTTDSAVTGTTPVWTTPGTEDSTDAVVIGIVIVLILCTLVGLAFVLYHYLCHSKGVYRTTGEPAPGLDPDQVYQDTVTENKKEYFI